MTFDDFILTLDEQWHNTHNSYDYARAAWNMALQQVANTINQYDLGDVNREDDYDTGYYHAKQVALAAVGELVAVDAEEEECTT